MKYIIISVFSFAYYMYAVAFSGKRTGQKYYQKILDPQKFLWHFAAAALLLIPAYGLARNYDPVYFMLSSPFIFLLILQFSNWITKTLYARNVILLYKGDVKPGEFVWYVDGVLSALCLIIPMITPGLLSNYFVRFHEIRIGVTN